MELGAEARLLWGASDVCGTEAASGDNSFKPSLV